MFVMLMTADGIGRGDEELAALLMRNFLYALARSDEKPDSLLLMNGGVRLACEGSDSLDDLRLLVEQGVKVRACGTCLDFLRLKDALAVGEVGTMVEAVSALATAERVVTVA